MKDSWLCRDYRPGDEHQILSLYKQVNDRDLGLDFWKWRYAENPFGTGVIKLLFDEDELIGHYAVVPVNIQVEDVPVRAVFSMNTITHPDYGRQGIFTYLARETYKECQMRGFKFVYGFPNKNSYHGFTKRLHWQGLGKMSLLYKDLQEGVSHPPLSKRVRQIHQVERFGEDIDLLWHKVKGEYNVIVPRTREFLNWRYVEHPEINYAKYVGRDNSGQAVGYVVLKIFKTENETRGHIVDILSLNDKGVIKELVRSTSDYFTERGIGNVSCWMQDNHFCAGTLKEEGFVRKEVPGSYPHFGAKVFEEMSTQVTGVEDIASWYLTMGDCDVF